MQIIIQQQSTYQNKHDFEQFEEYITDNLSNLFYTFPSRLRVSSKLNITYKIKKTIK